MEGGRPRGCAHLLPLSPPPPRRCHRKTNTTTAWTGESRDPGRRASDHPHRRAGDSGPPRYLQPARLGPLHQMNARSAAPPPRLSPGSSQRPQGPSEHRSPVWCTGPARKGKERVSLRAPPGEPRGLRRAGSLRKPGSARLLTLSHLSVLAVGSLLPTGGATFGKVGFSRLFDCRGACVPPPPRPPTMVRGVRVGRFLANPPRSGMCPPQGSLFGDLAQEKRGRVTCRSLRTCERTCAPVCALTRAPVC